MSDESKTAEQLTKMLRLTPDFCMVEIVHERVAIGMQARFAASFLAAVVTTESLRHVLSEDDSPAPSPKRAASYACDLAQQLMNQFEERGWLVHLRDPVPAPQEAEIVRKRISGEA